MPDGATIAWAPQPGPQQALIECPVYEILYGGARGGGKTDGKVLNLAARHKDGEWIMVYLGEKASFSVNVDKIAGDSFEAYWIDPRTGKRAEIGTWRKTGVQSFSTPDGWEDAILMLEASAG